MIGIAGAAIGQTLFAFATSLPAFYAARAIGGILTAALFPAAAAFVVDATRTDERARGMAWLGTAVSLGAMVGPGLGGVLARTTWQLRTPSGTVLVSSFSVPFLAATTLALLAFAGALAWLPEARTAPVNADAPADLAQGGADRPRALWPLLALAVAGQFGLAIFESTFALYGNRMWNYGPSEIGAAFMACGLVMTIAQIGVTTRLARRAMGELTQVALGFGMVGAGLALLSVARGRVAVLAVVAVLALGLALIAPNLAALIAMRSSRARTGRALGIQSAANSVGLVLGTLAGGGLLAWQMEAPFLVAATLLLILSAVVGWRVAAHPPRRA